MVDSTDMKKDNTKDYADNQIKAPGKAIKVIHFADLHLGMENYGRIDPKTGLHQRVIDFLKSFNFLVNAAIERDVALVVFAGDAFRNQKPNPTLQREFARMIRRLTKADIKVVLLVGNHDLPNMTKQAHAMAVYGALELDGVYVASNAELLTIDTKQGPVQVATLPHFSRSQLTASLKEDSVEYNNKTLGELSALMSQRIEQFVANLAADVDTDLPAILTAHASVSTAVVGTECRSIMSGHEMTILPGTLQRPEFDYVALGHIHKFQDLSKGAYPHLVYSGSIDRVDFGEEKEEKGFCLIDLVRGKTTYEFVTIPARRFITIDVDCKTDNPTEEVCNKCAEHDLVGAVVRVRISLSSRLREQVRKDEIMAALSNAYYIAYITIETVDDDVRTRNPHVNEGQTPFGALGEYIKTREDLIEREKELLDYGKRLIDELMQKKA
jgi:exonuclease SbcD